MGIKKDLKHAQVPKAINKKFNTNIITQAGENNNIKTEVENILGYAVDDEQYQDAYEYSKRKLNWQGQRYNTQYDERYTAIVVAENYEQQILMGYMNTLQA